MSDVEILSKLIDKKAIEFINENKKDYDKQYSTFINMNMGNTLNINGQEYILGLDLSEDKDMTVYTPL